MTKQKIILRELELLKELRELATDKKTLEWGETSEEEMNWKEAKEWCERKKNDWRMPTRLELIEAYDNKMEGFEPNGYWSADTYQPSRTYAYCVDFCNGLSYVNTKPSPNYVRCVR